LGRKRPHNVIWVSVRVRVKVGVRARVKVRLRVSVRVRIWVRVWIRVSVRISIRVRVRARARVRVRVHVRVWIKVQIWVWVKVRVRVRVNPNPNPNPNPRYLQHLTMGSFWIVAAAKLHFLLFNSAAKVIRPSVSSSLQLIYRNHLKNDLPASSMKRLPIRGRRLMAALRK